MERFSPSGLPNGSTRQEHYDHVVNRCKYCRQRFTGFHGGYRYYSHLRQHERNIKPYWYTTRNKLAATALDRVRDIRTDRSHKPPSPNTIAKHANTPSLKLRFSVQKGKKFYEVTPVTPDTLFKSTHVSSGETHSISKSPSSRKRSRGQETRSPVNGETAARQASAKSAHEKDGGPKRVDAIPSRQISPNAHRYCDEKCKSYGNKKSTDDGKAVKKRYHCQFCANCFSQKGGLVIHERIHLGIMPFSCDICSKSFYDKSNLTKHKRIHNNDTIYKCKFCGKSGTDPSNIKQHEKMHTSEAQFKCTYCGRLFTSKTGCAQHERTHKGVKPYSCHYCGRKFNLRGELRYHEMLHTGERPHKCPHCELSFTRAYRLKLHVRIHDDVRAYKCGLCEKRFTTNWIRKSHEESHSSDTYKCTFCTRVFSTSSGKNTHERSMHVQNEQKVHPCKICGAMYTSPYQRNKHEKQKHPNATPRHRCPREGCTVTFRHRRDIATHLITDHTAGDKPLDCGACGKSFVTEYLKAMHEQHCKPTPKPAPIPTPPTPTPTQIPTPVPIPAPAPSQTLIGFNRISQPFLANPTFVSPYHAYGSIWDRPFSTSFHFL